MYQIMATLTHCSTNGEGINVQKSIQIPTFHLDENIHGIQNAEHAKKIAKSIIMSFQSDYEGFELSLDVLRDGFSIIGKHTLIVETDDDFQIEFKGKVYYGHFAIQIESVDELNELIVCDRTSDTKCYEFDLGIAAIKANPNKPFSNLGGNRGVEWWVNSLGVGTH